MFEGFTVPLAKKKKKVIITVGIVCKILKYFQISQGMIASFLVNTHHNLWKRFQLSGLFGSLYFYFLRIIRAN